MVDPIQHPERLFLALWPDPVLAAELQTLADRLVLPGQGRVIDARNLHLTLAFLGSIDPQQRQCIEENAGEGRPVALSLELDCLGYWYRSRILWVGSSHTPGVLRGWVDHLRGMVAACGLPVDSRPFRTHVTVARNVRRYRGLGRGGKVSARMRHERVDGIERLNWPVKALTLVASDTRPQGARYRILREWPLD